VTISASCWRLFNLIKGFMIFLRQRDMSFDISCQYSWEGVSPKGQGG
jgi:hypothetical protein